MTFVGVVASVHALWFLGQVVAPVVVEVAVCCVVLTNQPARPVAPSSMTRRQDRSFRRRQEGCGCDRHSG